MSTDSIVVVTAAGRDEEPRWEPTPDELVNIRTLASLKYTISEIALALDIAAAEIRRHLASENDPVYRAYNAGRVEGDIPYRRKVMAAAARGEEWAVKLAESWNRKQLEDQLGCHL